MFSYTLNKFRPRSLREGIKLRLAQGDANFRETWRESANEEGEAFARVLREGVCLLRGQRALLLLVLSCLALPPTSHAESPASNTRSTHRAALDSDHDGIPDSVEIFIGTDPRNPDSDGDGIPDGDEQLSTAGTSLREAYARGYLADDDGESEGDDDRERRISPRPQRRLPVCTRKRQRNCRLPMCTKKLRKNCRPSTPPPNPGSGSGNFDPNGNTTKFGIPAGTTGNVNAGAPIWQNTCADCHSSERRNRSFNQINAALQIPAMRGINLSVQQLADLTAYLNRVP